MRDSAELKVPMYLPLGSRSLEYHHHQFDFSLDSICLKKLFFLHHENFICSHTTKFQCTRAWNGMGCVLHDNRCKLYSKFGSVLSS